MFRIEHHKQYYHQISFSHSYKWSYLALLSQMNIVHSQIS